MCNRTKLLLQNTDKFSNHEFLLEHLKNYQGGENLTQKRLHGLTIWKDMLKNALRDFANWRSVSSPCRMIIISRTRNLKQLENGQKCPHMKCLYLERIGRPDILWSVNKLARSVTMWTGACDKRLARLISYIFITEVTSDILSCGKTRVNIVDWVFSKTQILLATSGGIFCVYGGRTFIPKSCMCKKQTSVSHSSTQSKSFRWMLDREWMDYLLLVYGMW